RVVQDAALLQVRDKPAHLMVGMAQEAGRDFHLSLEQGLLSIVVLVPPAYARVGLWQDRALRHHTQLVLALERLGTDDIPAGAERAAVRLPPLAPNVVRDVQRAEAQVKEKRSTRGDGGVLLYKPNAAISQVLAEVVATLTVGWRLDAVVVFEQR